MIKIPKIPIISANSIEKAIMAKMFAVTQDVNALIRSRTNSGIDVNHNQFIEYSPLTIESKKQRNIKGSIVKLKESGKMMRSLKNTKTNFFTYTIFLNDATRSMIGYAHQTGANNLPVRKWFGINQADADKIYLKYFDKKPVLQMK